MNKGLLGIILAVLLGAMVLIMVNQKGTPPSGPADAATAVRGQENGTANRTQATAQRPASQAPAGQARPANATTAAVTPPAAAPAGAAPSASNAPSSGTASAPGGTPPPLPKVDPPASVLPPAAAPAAKPAATPAATANASSVPAARPAPDAAPAAKPTPAAKPDTAKPLAVTPAKGPHSLKNISLHFKGKGVLLRIESDNAFTGKTFVLPGPDRMVVDLAGEWNNMRAPSVPSNNLVKGVRIGKQSGGPRLVLDLARPPKSHEAVRPSPTLMEITVE